MEMIFSGDVEMESSIVEQWLAKPNIHWEHRKVFSVFLTELEEELDLDHGKWRSKC